MHRILSSLALLLLLSAPLRAQIGKSISVGAGSPEDRALNEINAASDPAKKLALLDKFLEEYGKGDLAILAYELYVAQYASERNYDKAFEYGEKALALDPDSFSMANTLFRVAQEKGDTVLLLNYGERVGAILQRYKARPAPEGMPAEQWEHQKAEVFEKLRDSINYTQYTMFNAGLQNPSPATRAEMLERFVAAFPDSLYAATAQSVVAAAYQQAQNYPKMLDFAQKILTADPNNVGMLLLLADYWSEKGEELDRAESFASRALDLLAAAKKPEGMTDEQWAQQKSIQQGLAQSSLGQVFINRKRLAQAVEAFRAASPLLKPDPVTYGRNLYRLGYTLALMKNNVEARKVLAEAVSVESPYKALAQETLTKIGGLGKAPTKKRP